MFGNTIPDNINIKFSVRFGILVPNFSIIKICIEFDRSVSNLPCTDRKCEFPIGINTSEQTSGHDRVSKYMDNPFLDVLGYF